HESHSTSGARDRGSRFSKTFRVAEGSQVSSILCGKVTHCLDFQRDLLSVQLWANSLTTIWYVQTSAVNDLVFGDNAQLDGPSMEKDFLILKRASASRPSGEWNDDDYDVLALASWSAASSKSTPRRSDNRG